MKKLLLIVMCLSMLCMVFSITAFASDELTQEDLVPDGAEIVQGGQSLENGKTYYIVWVPYGAYSGGGYQLLVGVAGDLTGYYAFSIKINAYKSLSSITGWYGEWEVANSPYIITANQSQSWDESCFVFPDVAPNQIEKGKYYTVQFTVPNDNKTYYLRSDVGDLSQYSAQVYTYTPCEHLYDNSCDTHCNKCNHERSITHIYLDDDNHNCSVCGIANPQPTHIYDNSCDAVCNGCDYEREIEHTYSHINDHNCSICGVENSQPTHVYDDDNDLICNYCNYERPKPDAMKAFLNNVASSSAAIFGIAGIFTTWAIADELVAFGLVLSIISFMAYLVIRSKNSY